MKGNVLSLLTMAKKRATLPSPQILQRAAKVVLTGQCKLSGPLYLKLKRHRQILRKLAALKGDLRKKKAFITRHKKQIGGFLPLLPLILKSVGMALPVISAMNSLRR